MSYWEILIIALALSADAFSIGAVVGLRFSAPPQIFRLSFHFGLFQSIMSAAGIGGGALLASYIVDWDHWLIFFLLALIGAKMIHEALGAEKDDADNEGVDPTVGWSLLGLSIAVSLDALGAGVGLGLTDAPRVSAITIIGIVSWAATFAAMKGARRIRAAIGRHAEWLGGVVLILLGLKIVLEHLEIIG